MPTLFDVPEIRTHIGRVLDNRSLITCLRLSSEWYATLLPLVWDTVELSEEGLSPFGEELDDHAHLIKHLVLTAPPSAFFRTNLLFPQLDSLTIVLPKDDLEDEDYVMFPLIAQVLLQNETLTKVDFKCFEYPYFPSTLEVWEAFAKLPNLKTLHLKQFNVDEDSSESFWKICTKLEKLIILGGNISVLPPQDPALTVFPRLSYLDLVFAQDSTPVTNQLEIILRAPALESLLWEPEKKRSHDLPEALLQHLSGSSCADLAHLKLYHVRASDADLASILASKRPLKTLRAQSIDTSGSPLSTAAIRPHCQTLEYLSIAGGGFNVSELVLEVVSSCQTLTTLTRAPVLIRNVMQSPEWICKSLTKLDITFGVEANELADESDAHQIIFDRLSCLEGLKDLTMFVLGVQGETVDGLLKIRIGHGFEKLATLKRLEKVYISGAVEKMDVEVAKWMVEHWQHLVDVEGSWTAGEDFRKGPQWVLLPLLVENTRQNSRR